MTPENILSDINIFSEIAQHLTIQDIRATLQCCRSTAQLRKKFPIKITLIERLAMRLTTPCNTQHLAIEEDEWHTLADVVEKPVSLNAADVISLFGVSGRHVVRAYNTPADSLDPWAESLLGMYKFDNIEEANYTNDYMQQTLADNSEDEELHGYVY